MQRKFVGDSTTSIGELIGQMKAISLEEMAAVRLMNRKDTKFLLALSDLPSILVRLSEHYRVQEIAGKRMASYETLYFDSSGHQFFLEHVNGKLNRRKVRRRTYLDSGLHFMEVKRKTNKDKTVKTRVLSDGHPENQNGEAIELVRKQADADLLTLIPLLSNRFTRVTLVNPAFTERVTIDFRITFRKFGTDVVFDQFDLAVIEVKQDKSSPSFISELLRDQRIKKAGFSKYCYGMVMTGQVEKLNNMKRKLRRIKKIIHHEYVA